MRLRITGEQLEEMIKLYLIHIVPMPGWEVDDTTLIQDGDEQIGSIEDYEVDVELRKKPEEEQDIDRKDELFVIKHIADRLREDGSGPMMISRHSNIHEACARAAMGLEDGVDD